MNWFNQALIIIFTFIVVLTLLANRRNGLPKCGCGHESSWHSETGCHYKKYGANEGYDYLGNCTCPRTQTEAERKVA